MCLWLAWKCFSILHLSYYIEILASWLYFINVIRMLSFSQVNNLNTTKKSSIHVNTVLFHKVAINKNGNNRHQVQNFQSHCTTPHIFLKVLRRFSLQNLHKSCIIDSLYNHWITYLFYHLMAKWWIGASAQIWIQKVS